MTQTRSILYCLLLSLPLACQDHHNRQDIEHHIVPAYNDNDYTLHVISRSPVIPFALIWLLTNEMFDTTSYHMLTLIYGVVGFYYIIHLNNKLYARLHEATTSHHVIRAIQNGSYIHIYDDVDNTTAPLFCIAYDTHENKCYAYNADNTADSVPYAAFHIMRNPYICSELTAHFTTPENSSLRRRYIIVHRSSPLHAIWHYGGLPPRPTHITNANYNIKQIYNTVCPIDHQEIQPGDHNRLSCGHAICTECWDEFSSRYYSGTCRTLREPLTAARPRYRCPFCKNASTVNNYQE